MNGDECRNFSYALINEMKAKIENGETLTDNDKRYLADLLRIEAQNKDSDTQAYKAGLEYDADMKKARQDLIKAIIDNGVKVGTVAAVCAMICVLIKVEETGTANMKLINMIWRMIKC